MQNLFLKSKIITCPHAFSTRNGGVSNLEFSSLNLGFEYGDNPNNIKKNWNIFSSESNVNIDNLVWTKQVHNNKVKIVKKSDIQNGALYTKFNGYDGLITKEKHITLTIFTADCAPVLLQDTNNNVIAALHCGWKPLCSDVVKNGISAMLDLGANTESIVAAIGPCIGPCCFEVKKDVITALEHLLKNKSHLCYSLSKKANGKYYVDLSKAIEIRLNQLGVSKIEKVNKCTSCNVSDFFSYRKENGKTGRLANIICLI